VDPRFSGGRDPRDAHMRGGDPRDMRHDSRERGAPPQQHHQPGPPGGYDNRGGYAGGDMYNNNNRGAPGAYDRRDSGGEYRNRSLQTGR
jgi:hypothetical protein